VKQAQTVQGVHEAEAAKHNFASHAAVHALREHDRSFTPAPVSGRDLSQSSLRAAEPMVGRDYGKASCPVAPQRCPFGGACHACPARVQRKMATNQAEHEPAEVPPLVAEALRSPSQPIDAMTRAAMEPRFGREFGGVRVHVGPKAAESAAAINSVAYTLGRDVVFGAGQYAPETPAGAKLIAHELTHVAQQDGTGVPERLTVGHAGDVYECEADRMALNAQSPAPPAASLLAFASGQPGRVQGQFVTPLGPGGGFGGLLERDRRRAFGGGPSQQQGEPHAQPSTPDACDVQLCFLPLEALVSQGVSPELAYVAAVHAFIRWDGRSAGFTRLAGERIGDARVISPEPRAGEPHERCVRARLRTVPTPTPGQSFSLTPIGTVRDLISYGTDVYTGLTQCPNPTCQSAKQRIQNMLVDDRRGLYSLYDENCETWARNVLSAACMEAPSVPGGGYGNLFQQILRETPGGDLYHAARRLLGRTRPMPTP
jgi:hypothetical protein